VDYAEAFVELIQSVETQLPLTIGIFGSWGVGKTTLMELITRRLRESPQTPRSQESVHEPTVSRVHIITFSAWEYSAREAIWPGLVRKIMDGLEKEISWPFPGRFLTKLGWNLRSALKKEKGRIFVIGCILIAAAAAAVTLFLEQDLANEDIWKPLLAAGVTGLAGIVGGVLKIVGDTLSRPMGQWLATAFQEDGYGRPIAHFAKIKEDLEFLDKRLNADKKRPERALIIIDDLDRCEPGKAVEMLQAIKLLLDVKSFVVCMGIDARIITRVVEKHYKDLLGEAGASGYEYLDKIVQIPFRIPAPEKKQIEKFLAEQMGNPKPSQPDSEPVRPASDNLPRSGMQEPARAGGEGTKAAVTSPPPSAPAPPRPTTSAFTYRELQAFQSMAECLRANPRHLKRLLNVYRLVRTLADMRDEQILLDKPGAAICWVVLCAQWPYTTYLMLRRLKQAEEEKGFELPQEDPLTWLLSEVREEIDLEVRKRLDQDPNLLLRLIQECSDARMTWDELRTIRRYTINFNPAIELEAIAEAPSAKPAESRGA
jgi:Cdc6-like AAA superfamily ATPase